MSSTVHRLTVIFRSFALFLQKNLIFLSILCVCSYAFSAWLIYNSPEEVLQLVYVKIIYVHVPAAWLGIGIYFVMSIISFIALVWNIRIADILAYSLAPIGMVFTLICLITGSLWGKPIWNAWWVWDARLTSMLILLFLYIGYLIIWDNDIYYSKVAATINIIGVINVPIIKFSVAIWTTLHQSSSFFRSGGVAIANEMLVPLLCMLFSSSILAIIFWILNTESVINQCKIENHIRSLG